MLDIRTLSRAQLAKTIDHSLLRPELTPLEVRQGCDLALEYDVASVCVKPADVPLAVQRLAESTVAVGTVIGFPHGGGTTATKVFEAKDAISNGAAELDMVINIGRLRDGDLTYVQDEIAAVVAAGEGALIKVILENAYLDHDQKVAAYRAVEAAGAHFVKTSTGFAPSGSTLDDLRLMRATVGPNVQVKAAHGIRTLEALLEVLEAGATRVGATATKAMLDGYVTPGAPSPDTSGY